MPFKQIRDIIERGAVFKRLSFTITRDSKEARIYMEEKGFTEKYGTVIQISTNTKRLGELARDILKALGLKAKYEKWKPTLQDLEYRLDQTDAMNRLNFWFIDMIRIAVTMKDERKVAQVKEIYEWLRSNEDWLYKKGDYAKT